MRFLKDAGSILLSAALLTLAFPASDLHFLAWVALVPLFVRILSTTSRKKSWCVFFAPRAS